jgi:hypothetical protein
LEQNPGPLYMLGKCSTKLHLQPTCYIVFDRILSIRKMKTVQHTIQTDTEMEMEMGNGQSWNTMKAEKSKS